MGGMSQRPQVIISDPDQRVANALRVELLESNCRVLMAPSAEEAEELTRRFNARLIILDVSQIKYRGYSACARIRRQPYYANRPIILTTAHVQARDAAAAGTAGATALLAKPYSVKQLLRAIRPHLAANDPLRACLPAPVDTSIDWSGTPGWQFTPDSGLRAEKGIMAVIAGLTTHLPLGRVT